MLPIHFIYPSPANPSECLARFTVQAATSDVQAHGEQGERLTKDSYRGLAHVDAHHRNYLVMSGYVASYAGAVWSR